MTFYARPTPSKNMDPNTDTLSDLAYVCVGMQLYIHTYVLLTTFMNILVGNSSYILCLYR